MEETVKEWTGRLSLRIAARETLIFSKWIYRHRNQQRRHKCFQKIKKIEKDLKRYYDQSISSYIRDVIKNIFDADSTSVDESGQLLSAANRLSQCAQYVARLIAFMEFTFIDLYQKIEFGHLITAFSVIAASLCRLWFYMITHLWAIAEVYAALTGGLDKTEAPPLHVILPPDHVKYLPPHLVVPATGASDHVTKEEACLKEFVEPQLLERREKDFASAHIKPQEIKTAVGATNHKIKRRVNPNTIVMQTHDHRGHKTKLRLPRNSVLSVLRKLGIKSLSNKTITVRNVLIRRNGPFGVWAPKYRLALKIQTRRFGEKAMWSKMNSNPVSELQQQYLEGLSRASESDCDAQAMIDNIFAALER